MNTTLTKRRISGTITAPASKSYAQRAVAAALLSTGETTLTNVALCNDTAATLEVARNLGAEITNENSTYRITGGLKPISTKLNIHESGLATRLFTPIAALCNQAITISGVGSILERPIIMMEYPLAQLGVDVTTNGGYLPITVKGPLRGGEITIDGSLSSQFITGLLMALPLAKEETTLTVNNLKSRPYIDMTIAIAESFGVNIEHTEYSQFFIEGGQTYKPTTYNIEGDWSGASCLLVAGAIGGKVTITNLNPISLQADTAIIEALANAGAQIISTEDSVTVRRTDLKSFDFDATHCPDLFPALAALAANCSGVSRIKGTSRLTFKESDRSLAIAKVFGAMGIDVNLDQEDYMIITGGEIHASTVDSHNDHRIAMAAAVAALGCKGEVIITGSEAVDKSYPEFWDDLDKISLK